MESSPGHLVVLWHQWLQWHLWDQGLWSPDQALPVDLEQVPLTRTNGEVSNWCYVTGYFCVYNSSAVLMYSFSLGLVG